MDREQTENKLEKWLDSALAEYGRAEPRPGIEARIIEHLRGRNEINTRRFQLRPAIWMPVGAVALLLFLFVLSPNNQGPSNGDLPGGTDEELLLGIDELLNREVPAALEPALVLTQEIARSKK